MYKHLLTCTIVLTKTAKPHVLTTSGYCTTWVLMATLTCPRCPWWLKHPRRSNSQLRPGPRIWHGWVRRLMVMANESTSNMEEYRCGCWPSFYSGIFRKPTYVPQCSKPVTVSTPVMVCVCDGVCVCVCESHSQRNSNAEDAQLMVFQTKQMLVLCKQLE